MNTSHTSPVIFGTAEPIFDSSDIAQAYSDTCAIKSQQLILETFGIDVTEESLIQDALSLNIYEPGHGTPVAHMGDLLELHGVKATLHEPANIYTLMHELAQGHQVIVAVDSSELWTPDFSEVLEDMYMGPIPDHALIVTGIDASDPGAVEVILTDPGTGNVTRYPYEQFADAWADSSFAMVSTNESPTEIEAGILPQIMGQDTNDWLSEFGHYLEEGVDVAVNLIDYLAEHPELVKIAGTVVMPFLASNAEAAESSGIDVMSDSEII